jgi:hypothetical protein
MIKVIEKYNNHLTADFIPRYTMTIEVEFEKIQDKINMGECSEKLLNFFEVLQELRTKEKLD